MRGAALAAASPLSLVPSPQESDITPRETIPVTGAESSGGSESPRARNEWWRPVAWAALALLVAEWLVAQRGRLAWIANAVKR